MNQLELPMPITGLPLDLKALAVEIHADNIRMGWWKKDPDTGRTLNRNIGELIALIHSEISEADFGVERSLMDDKLPHRAMAEVELADVSIRVLDLLGFYEHRCTYDGQMSHGGEIPNLPEYVYWPDWCRLMHRITTQALEGFRKGDPARGCDNLAFLLRVISAAAIHFRFDLTGAIAEKRAFNATRADHKVENRAAAGGKQF